ncbi:MAG: cohesin domain-containing protein, partial [Dehalococcoidia bacterium]
HPSDWIIMLDQPAPILIVALDPTFFPNGLIAKFDVPAGTTVEDFAATFLNTQAGPVLGYTNIQPGQSGTMTLATGVTVPYISFNGNNSGYNMDAKGVFLQDGNVIYYMQCANFPFMWDDTAELVDQILGTLHIASGTASAGWPVAVNSSWCTPVAQAVTATGNRAEIAWWQQGGFNSGTAFTAVYHVTVPTDAVIGNIYTFPNGTLEYRINGSNPATVMPITGDSQVQVNTAGRSIIITPATGPRGTNVSVTGSGFTPGTSVDISFGGVIVTASTTNAAGAFTAAFAVPLQATSGANAVVATDGAGLTASATFTVPPAAITVSPTSGPPGTTVTVMGTGFPAYLSLTLILDAAIVTPSPVVITDASGDFTATFVVLGLAPGLHTVSATCGGVVATAVFTITNQQHYTLTTSVDPAASGSVSLNPTQPAGGYNSGTLITLTPNPATGYVFDHWSGDVTGTANPGSVTMNSNKSITAHFAPPGVTVTVNAPARVSTNYDFTVSIDISEVTDLNSVQYDIGFDTSVLRLDSIDAGQIAATSIPVASNEISGGHYRVVQSLGLSSVSGSGSLAVLHFHSIGAIGTSSAIDISNGLLSGMSGGIPATWVDDTVQVSVIPGDANGDGAVNVLDMTKVAREILQLDQLTPGADANLDGLVNVLDMTKIARIILLLDPS